MATISPLADAALEKILEDQKDFEKEHQFMQVCISYFVDHHNVSATNIKVNRKSLYCKNKYCFSI